MAKKPGFELRIEGARELQKSIRAMQDKDLRKELRLANKAAATVVADEAEIEAPVGPTGRLARSIGVLAGQSSATVKAGSAARVPYAAPIHFGWPARGIAANPFIYRALAKKSEEMSDIYEEKISALAARLGSTLR